MEGQRDPRRTLRPSDCACRVPDPGRERSRMRNLVPRSRARPSRRPHAGVRGGTPRHARLCGMPDRSTLRNNTARKRVREQAPRDLARARKNGLPDVVPCSQALPSARWGASEKEPELENDQPQAHERNDPVREAHVVPRRRAERSFSELPITVMSESTIARAPTHGASNSPVHGHSTPAAIGIPITL